MRVAVNVDDGDQGRRCQQEERNRQPAVADKAKQYIGIGSKWLRSAGTNIAKVALYSTS